VTLVVTLCCATLAAMLATLGYVASRARKLDASLDSLLHAQREQRREMEESVERLRQYYNRT
jgi:hypothetical protein